MPKVVKSLAEANEQGLLNIPKAPTQSDLGKIISDIKGIVEGVQAIRNLAPKKEELKKEELAQMNFNSDKTEINKKLPVAVLKIDKEKINNFLDNIFNNPNLKTELTIGEIKEKWSLIKELIKPELETAINQIVKAEIEYR